MSNTFSSLNKVLSKLDISLGTLETCPKLLSDDFLRSVLGYFSRFSDPAIHFGMKLKTSAQQGNNINQAAVPSNVPNTEAENIRTNDTLVGVAGFTGMKLSIMAN